MQETVFSTHNYQQQFFIGGKKIFYLILELVVLLAAIITNNFSWLVSFNIALLWYPFFYFFWFSTFVAAQSVLKKKLLIWLFLSFLKILLYLFPFLLVYWGEAKLGKTIFNLVPCLLGIFTYSWFLTWDLIKRE